MRNLAFLVAALLVATPAWSADPAEGDWAAGGQFVIRVEPCAKSPVELCGIIAAAPPGRDGKPKLDLGNPDPALRSRPMLGLALLHGFHRDAAGRWSGGKIYDPDSGKTFDSTLTATPGGGLNVAGCVLVFCKSQTWPRAQR